VRVWLLSAGAIGLGLGNAMLAQASQDTAQTAKEATAKVADPKLAPRRATDALKAAQDAVKDPRIDGVEAVDVASPPKPVAGQTEAAAAAAANPALPPKSPPAEQEIDKEPTPELDDRPIVMRNANLPLYEDGELLAFLKPGENSSELSGIEVLSEQSMETLGVTMVHARITGAENVEGAIARLEGQSRLAWVQPNYIYQLLANSRSRGLAMHGLDDASALLPQGLPAIAPTAKLVLIDSPVDLSHPSLAGAAISQEGAFAQEAPSPHGTAISEILVGTGDFPGIASGAQLISIPAFTPVDTNDCHTPSIATTRRLVKAFHEASDFDPDVLNLYFGSPTSTDPAMQRSIDTMFDAGVCIAAAAGNALDDPVMFPARLPSTIAVAAVDASERNYQYGSRGDSIDIASWGVSINAAVPLSLIHISEPTRPY